MKNFQIVSLENEKDPEYNEELERGVFVSFSSHKFKLRDWSAKGSETSRGKSFKTKESRGRSLSRAGIFLRW